MARCEQHCLKLCPNQPFGTRLDGDATAVCARGVAADGAGGQLDRAGEQRQGAAILSSDVAVQKRVCEGQRSGTNARRRRRIEDAQLR